MSFSDIVDFGTWLSAGRFTAKVTDLHAALEFLARFVIRREQLAGRNHAGVTDDRDRVVVDDADNRFAAGWPLRRLLGRAFPPGEFRRVVLDLPCYAFVLRDPDAGQIVVAERRHHGAARQGFNVRLHAQKAE